MKKVLLMMFIGFLSLSNVLMAQDYGAKRGGKMLELKKAFLQEKLSLTDAEMSKFWPIHENYIRERRDVKKALLSIKDKVKNNDNLSEGEFSTLVDELSDLRIDEIKLDKSYAKSAVAVIGVSRFKKIKQLEKEFNNKMREKRDARNGGQGKPGRDAPSPDREDKDR